MSNADLTAAISGTAMNPTSVSTLTLTVSDPPTQNDVQQVVNKVKSWKLKPES